MEKDKANTRKGIRVLLGAGAEGMIWRDFEDIVLPSDVSLVMPVQTHSLNVGLVRSVDEKFPDTDALISMTDKIAVGVRTADCVPILLNANDIGAVAAIHAGWKGTIGEIVVKTIDKLIGLGADRANIHAAIGPAICGDCYEVGEDLACRFAEKYDLAVFKSYSQGEGYKKILRWHVDLPLVNKIQLIRSGVGQIYECGRCTMHSSEVWPSWRREPGTDKRLVTVARLIKKY